MQSIGDGVITTDADGNVEFLNSAAEALTGWPPHEARGQPLTTVFALIDERQGNAVWDPVKCCLEAGETVVPDGGEILMQRRGYRYFSVQASAALIRKRGPGDRRTVLGEVLIFADVTETRRHACPVLSRSGSLQDRQ